MRIIKKKFKQGVNTRIRNFKSNTQSNREKLL